MTVVVGELLLALGMAVAAGLVGCFAVMRKMTLASDAIAHVALPGIGIALLLGIQPILGAIVTLCLGTFLIWVVETKTRVPTETVIGVVFSAALALGALLTEGEHLIEALFGRPGGLGVVETVFGLAGSIGVGLFVITQRYRLAIALVSRDLARTPGIDVPRLSLLYLMRLADFIEGYTTERSRVALRELLKLAPETARVERGGGEVEVPAREVGRGEVVLVKPGERIPVDGTVVEGRASVNQASITGESVPVEKTAGAHVFAATICDRGALRIRTERVGPETTFGQILQLVEQAEAAKAPVQRFADRFTAYYIPVVLAVAVATLLIGGSVTAAVATVLVACSCAIAIATPVTVLAAVGQAAKQGIVIKGGRYLEALAKVDTLVMDKTGTLTVGRPDVTDVVPLDDAAEDAVLSAAGSVERRSEHPLAEGIVRAAERRRIALGEPREFDVFTGEGVVATVAGERVFCGTDTLMSRYAIPVSEAVRSRIEALAAEGKSVVLVARGGRLIGIIALADTLRSEVPGALVALRRLGIRRQILLTGDRREVAAAVAGRLELEFEAEALPDQKIRVIERLQREGRVVAMVGDGINDAPALAQADVGIAMGVAGTDAALEAAHIALMRDDWRVLPATVQIGRRAFRTIQQNLWFTAGYNVVGMALAATGWLPPIAAAAAQLLPDVAVMLNSARLLRRQ